MPQFLQQKDSSGEMDIDRVSFYKGMPSREATELPSKDSQKAPSQDSKHCSGQGDFKDMLFPATEKGEGYRE